MYIRKKNSKCLEYIYIYTTYYLYGQRAEILPLSLFSSLITEWCHTYVSVMCVTVLVGFGCSGRVQVGYR